MIKFNILLLLIIIINNNILSSSTSYTLPNNDKLHILSSKLPLLPNENIKLDIEFSNKYNIISPLNGKTIPKMIWIAVKDSKQELPSHLHELFKRNPDWKIHIVGNNEKDLFIDTVFNNTSVQWAYHMINPALGAARADIWRYAALWLYGGFYIGIYVSIYL
jgi:mannosyltransferase OCH1-like enzyme